MKIFLARLQMYNASLTPSPSLTFNDIDESLYVCGPVAQLGEREHGMFEVAGSIPVRSTNSILNSCLHQ